MGPYNRKLGQCFLPPLEAAMSTVQEMLEAMPLQLAATGGSGDLQ